MLAILLAIGMAFAAAGKAQRGGGSSRRKSGGGGKVHKQSELPVKLSAKKGGKLKAFETIQGLLPGQAAAGAAVVQELVAVPASFSESSWLVSRFSLTSPSLVTGVATNNVTFNLRQIRGGSVLATLASVVLAAGTNLAAEQEFNAVLSSQGPLQAGDVLDVQMVQNGTGLAVPAGVLVKVELQ